MEITESKSSKTLIMGYNKHILYYLKGSDIMNSAKKILLNLIDEMPEDKIPDVIDFIGYLKVKNEMDIFKELQNASSSSIEFWDNDIDDEVWNNA